jgi:outer membrane phospholipase A
MSIRTASVALAALCAFAPGCAPPPSPARTHRVAGVPATLPAAATTAPTSGPTTAPATAPVTAPSTTAASPSSNDAASANDPKRRAHLGSFPSLLPHRPVYILLGPDAPNAKFQFSLKIPLLAPGPAEEDDPLLSNLSNLYFAYSQMSLWDITQPGKATIDTTYMPEAFFSTRTPPFEARHFGASALGFQVGVQHESNGRSGVDSRNVNYLYFEPKVYFGDPKRVHGEFAPKAKVYFGPQEDNPDIEDFLGYVELFGALRFGDDLHFTVTGRIGGDPDKGSFQLDVTYPLIRWRIDAYLQLQYFNGYGESLLGYRHHDQEVRLGVGFVR